MIAKKKLNPLLNGTIRFIVYGLLIFLLSEFMYWDARHEVVEEKFLESSYLEYLQSLLLFLSCIVLILIYKKYHVFRYTALLMFGFLGASFFREQDLFFETYLGMGTWQFPVYALLAVVIYTIIKNFSSFLLEVKEYVSSAPYGLFLMGVLTTYVFSRLFGRKVFWNAVMEDRYFRAVKNTAEECLELYGYMIILISVIELVLMAKKKSQLLMK
jgi:hypothetical protein